MFKRLVIAVLMVMLVSGTAMATSLMLGNEGDTWGLDTMYDQRTYHESHPGSQFASHLGGWYTCITIFGPNANLVDKVVMNFGPTRDGGVSTITFEEPSSYEWLGNVHNDYGFLNGHRGYISTNATARAYDHDGNLINFIHWDGTDLGTVLTASAPAETPVPSICKIKRMAIKRDGRLMVKFTAPYTEMNSQIRIRIMNEDGSAGIDQIRFDPPYQIVKNDGTIVPDKMKVFVEGQYAGHIARIEYRKTDDTGFMTRGITYFVLPSLEE